ncbi:MAG: hypothetical protein JWN69_677, partial [Alphaproteobacteria bacterium]|nr:hypothetical protein [Alphaproteobacteria bacterium]
DEQTGPGKELEYAEAPQLEGAADVLGAAAVEFEAPAVPIAPPPAPPPARDADPWADFLDDNDGDDDDFAWAQEDRTEPPAPAGAPARRASERAVGASDRPGAQRLNEPFRSDVDRRKHLGKNSVKR